MNILKSLLIFAISILFFACTSIDGGNVKSTINKGKHKSETPQLFVNYYIHEGEAGEMGKDSLAIITSKYFEVDLYKNEEGYTANKIIKRSFEGNNNRSVLFSVSDVDKRMVTFSSSVELLNFMSERGYEMVSTQEKKGHVSYIFKKE